MSRKISIALSQHHWINPMRISKPTLLYKIKYYWVGLINNEKHKFNYLEFRGALDILQKKGIAMYDDLYVAIQNEENINNEENNINLDNEIKDDIIETFKCLDEYLIKYHKLLWCTKAPVKQFLESYFEKRNSICEITTDELQNITSNRKRAEFRLDEMNTVVAELDVMSEFLKSSVDKNDQLLFKLFLIFLNILSVGGQYYWSNYGKMNLCINVNK